MEPEISTKSTKNEILAAYDELLKKVQEKKTDEPKKVQEQQKQETVVKNAATLSNEAELKELRAKSARFSCRIGKNGGSCHKSCFRKVGVPVRLRKRTKEKRN